MPIAIETRHLRKIYRRGRRPGLVALEDLDLQVQEGDIFGFIGPNGAGKSTTIKSLVGLVLPTSGEALLFGDPCGTPASRRHLGYLPETAVYHEFMGVGELLEVHARLAGVSAARRKARCQEALEAVRLQDRWGSRLSELSKGMRQRFGIAQAMIAEPPLLVLDEPTSGLDPLAQLDVKDIILRLKGQGITIFFSSHQLTDVELICDQIGILHRGRMLRCGNLRELLEDLAQVEVRFRGGPEQMSGYEPVEQDGDRVLRVPREESDKVVDLLRGAGAHLVGLQVARRSLEQAFFEITRSQGEVEER